MLPAAGSRPPTGSRTSLFLSLYCVGPPRLFLGCRGAKSARTEDRGRRTGMIFNLVWEVMIFNLCEDSS